MNFRSNPIGIDLGTSNVVIFQKGKGIIVREPSVVAMDKNTGNVVKVGSAARNMLGRTPGHIAAVHPIVGGVIADYELAAKMITEMVKTAVQGAIIKPHMIVSIPSGVTEVEERAVVQAVMEAGARRVYLIEEVRAAALGAHLPMNRPNGHLVVDIGGGTTDVGVVVSNEVAYSTSVKTAGIAFDRAIMDYIRRKYDFSIGENTAEEIKMTIGCVKRRDVPMKMVVHGRFNKKGYPNARVEISSDEICAALEPCVNQIFLAIEDVMEHITPELAADVIKNGITLTGGGSQIWGMDQLLADYLNTTCGRTDDADTCVAFGCGAALAWTANMNDGPINIARNRKMMGY